MTTATAKIKYKKAGLDWMPEVPEHWEVKRLKNIGNVVLAQGIPDNIDMESYRLQKEGEFKIQLQQGDELKPIPTDMRRMKSS